MANLVITGKVRKTDGRWTVAILANGKTMQSNLRGWDTWNEAFDCAHGLVRSWRNDRIKRGVA